MVATTASLNHTIGPSSKHSDAELEEALRVITRSKSSRLTQHTYDGDMLHTSYLTITDLAARTLGVDVQLFRQKPWWGKAVSIINDEIAEVENIPSLEVQINQAIRQGARSFYMGSRDTSQVSVSCIDLFIAVEKQLNLPTNFLSHGQYGQKALAFVKRLQESVDRRYGPDESGSGLPDEHASPPLATAGSCPSAKVPTNRKGSSHPKKRSSPASGASSRSSKMPRISRLHGSASPTDIPLQPFPSTESPQTATDETTSPSTERRTQKSKRGLRACSGDGIK